MKRLIACLLTLVIICIVYCSHVYGEQTDVLLEMDNWVYYYVEAFKTCDGVADVSVTPIETNTSDTWYSIVVIDENNNSYAQMIQFNHKGGNSIDEVKITYSMRAYDLDPNDQSMFRTALFNIFLNTPWIALIVSTVDLDVSYEEYLEEFQGIKLFYMESLTSKKEGNRYKCSNFKNTIIDFGIVNLVDSQLGGSYFFSIDIKPITQGT